MTTSAVEYGAEAVLVRIRARADDALSSAHRSLQDDQGLLLHATGVVDALASVGLLSEPQRSAWLLAFKSCPGHRDSRVWCAYCGDVPQEKEHG